MTITRRTLSLSALAASVVLPSCSREPAATAVQSFTVRDSVGIEIVSNHSPLWHSGEEWRLAERPYLELGKLEGDAEEMFTAPAARLLSDGRILISERADRELRLFAPDGSWLWTAGGEGKGPGEFAALDAAVVLPGDTILAFDRRSKRATWFSADGEFVRSVQISAGDRTTIGQGVLDAGTWLFASYLSSSDSAGLSRSQQAVQLVNSVGVPNSTLDTLTVDLSLTESRENSSLFVPLPFFARPVFSAGAGKAYLTDNTSWTIQVFDDSGNLTRLIRRDWEPRPVSDSDIELRIERQRRWQEQWNTSDEMKKSGLRMLEEGAHLSATLPPLSEYWVDRVGNLWTLDWYMPEWPLPAREYNVFDPNGVWLGPVTIPAGMVISDVGEDYIVVTVTDELDVQHVQIYELLKPTG